MTEDPGPCPALTQKLYEWYGPDEMPFYVAARICPSNLSLELLDGSSTKVLFENHSFTSFDNSQHGSWAKKKCVEKCNLNCARTNGFCTKRGLDWKRGDTLNTKALNCDYIKRINEFTKIRCHWFTKLESRCEQSRKNWYTLIKMHQYWASKRYPPYPLQ